MHIAHKCIPDLSEMMAFHNFSLNYIRKHHKRVCAKFWKFFQASTAEFKFYGESVHVHLSVISPFTICTKYHLFFFFANVTLIQCDRSLFVDC